MPPGHLRRRVRLHVLGVQRPMPSRNLRRWRWALHERLRRAVRAWLFLPRRQLGGSREALRQRRLLLRRGRRGARELQRRALHAWGQRDDAPGPVGVRAGSLLRRWAAAALRRGALRRVPGAVLGGLHGRVPGGALLPRGLGGSHRVPRRDVRRHRGAHRRGVLGAVRPPSLLPQGLGVGGAGQVPGGAFRGPPRAAQRRVLRGVRPSAYKSSHLRQLNHIL